MSKVKKTLAAIVAGLFPLIIARPLLNVFGHRIHRSARIGFSLVMVDLMKLDRDSRIGHFNFISNNILLLHEKSRIGHLNFINGPLNLVMKKFSAIGNGNKVSRAPSGVTYGSASLKLGIWSKITSGHRIDCTRSVSLGNFSTVAGVGSQIWTHGYVHELEGLGRYRIDGSVNISHNVYIGSSSFISMGVHIVSGVIVGGGTSISKSLLEPGLYVSSPVRQLSRPPPPEVRVDLVRVDVPNLVETVYTKKH